MNNDLEISDNDSDQEEFEELFDAGEHIDKSGETIPLDLESLDRTYLSALMDSVDEDFETKVYPVNRENKSSKFLSKPSRFLSSKNQPSASLESQVKNAAKDWEARNLRGKNLIDTQTTDVVKIDKDQKKKFIKDLSVEIDKLREYLINEIAPSQLAMASAFEQTNQTLESILGVKVDQSTKVLESMVADAIRLKIFSFLVDHLKLSKEQKKIITEKYFVLSVPTTRRNVTLSST
jgi:hypothetical protein